MRIMPAHEYKEYTVVINPAGTAEGKFKDAFSIHKGSNRLYPLAVTVVEQRSISDATTFDTEEEALRHATVLAHAWIDSRPE